MQEISTLYKDVTKYQHVERLGNDEVQGILQGRVWIQEKLDGANLTVAWDPKTEDFIICSRNNPVYADSNVANAGFQTAIDYVRNNIAFRLFFEQEGSEYMLRCEHLRKHKIPIKEDYTNKIVIFDVEHKTDGYVPYPDYKVWTRTYDMLWLEAIEYDNPDKVLNGPIKANVGQGYVILPISLKCMHIGLI